MRYWLPACLICLLTAGPTLADEPAPASQAAADSAPPGKHRLSPQTSLDDLRAIQAAVRAVVDQQAPATVCLVVGGATGSGVIIDEDGTVLTAAHVSGPPDRPCTFIFPDGTQVKGKTLGHNARQDAGMARITTKPPEGGWPHVELADPENLEELDWVVALGHPGGFEEQRPIVARLGRVQAIGWTGVVSDCTLLGGDSGGPLFNLAGQLVGIHSRIGLSTAQNVHVPVGVFIDGQDRMAGGEVYNQWVRPAANPDAPFLGVAGRNHRRGVEVVSVVEGSAAEAAGLEPGDIITAIDGRPVEDYAKLIERIAELKVDQRVKVVVIRDGRSKTLKATLQRRGGGGDE